MDGETIDFWCGSLDELAECLGAPRRGGQTRLTRIGHSIKLRHEAGWVARKIDDVENSAKQSLSRASF